MEEIVRIGEYLAACDHVLLSTFDFRRLHFLGLFTVDPKAAAKEPLTIFCDALIVTNETRA